MECKTSFQRLITIQTPSILYNKLDRTGKKYKHRMDLSYNLFKGASFRLEDLTSEEELAKQIADMPEIKQMWPVREYPVPKDEVIWTGNSATAAPESFNSINRRQSSDNTTFSPHVMTQVDLLRAEGVRGAGIRVAVVDTGIDYDHPALGGCFGEGCLVSFGTDLVGDAYTGGATPPVPDDDPDDCAGHGTHVAGIVAAQVNPYGFTGAAPDVTLGAYRVFGCDGSAGNDVLIAAFNQAYEDGADIITASIGGASGWTEDAWAVAVSRIVDAGTPCTVSAGNSGDQGQFYASTAAEGKGVASIASVDNTQAPAILLNATYNVANSSSASFGWTAGSPSNWGNISLPLWSVNFNTSDPANACSPLPDDTPDLSEYLVLIRRGSCTFVQKVENVVAKGAKYVMFYNNAAGATAVTAAVDGLVAVGMTTADTGAQWISLLSNGTDVTVNIVDPDFAAQYPSTRDNTATGGFLSTYTSWGPTYELDFYPQFSAPGGLILSTYPLELGGYAVLSGTSMACPLAAAVYALVSEVRGTLDPSTLEAVIASTANPNLFHNGVAASPFLAPTTQQGAGLIQAYDAAHTTALLSVGSISFNDTDNFLESAEFTIRNIGDDEVTFALSHVPAGTAYTLASDSIYPEEFPNEFTSQAATIAFASKEVTVPGNGEATVSLTLTPPTGVNTARLPVYNGYIALNGSDSSSLSLPYLGVAGSMRAATVLDARSSFLTRDTDPNYAPVAANTTFTIPARNSSTSGNVTYPAVAISLALGSPLLNVEARPAGSETSLGNIFGFPSPYNPRGATVSRWNGLLENGTLVPAGSYQLVTRALHIFGDEEEEGDWDVATSVPFSIRYV
jgi:subtilisin family serine protease